MNKNNGLLSFSFEWHSILRDLIFNAWTIVLAFGIGIMGVYIVQRTLYTPQYQSTTTLCVNTKTTSSSIYAGLSQSEQMAEILSKVFVQPSIKENAAEYAHMKFDGEITASVVKNTNFITLTVKANNPQKAYRLLTGVLMTYDNVSDEIFDNAVIRIMSAPTFSATDINYLSSVWRTRAALILAFLDACAIIFISLIRDTVKSKSGFDKKIDAELIGAIPHENKIKTVKDVFIKNKKGLLINESLFTSLKFSESYHQLAGKIKYLHNRNGDKVFAVTSVMENEGKSTAVSNIALSLAGNGYKVLVLDFDQKKPALYKMFKKDFEKGTEFAEVITGKVAPQDYKMRRYRKTNVYFAANTKSHPEAQKYLERRNINKILDYYRNEYDYIFIDTAPMVFDADVTNILPVADKSILIIRTDVTDSASINDAVRTIKNTGGSLAGCILNDVYPEFTLFGQAGGSESGTHYGYGHSYSYGKYGKYGKYSSYGKYNAYRLSDGEENDDAEKGDNK